MCRVGAEHAGAELVAGLGERTSAPAPALCVLPIAALSSSSPCHSFSLAYSTHNPFLALRPLLQTVLACRRFCTAFAAALQRGTTRAAAALPVTAAHLAEAFQAVDFEAMLDKDSACRVFM